MKLLISCCYIVSSTKQSIPALYVRTAPHEETRKLVANLNRFLSSAMIVAYVELFIHVRTTNKTHGGYAAKNIMRNHPRLGRSVASLVSMPTMLSPKKIKKKLYNEGDMPMESLDSELQAEPLPVSSTSLHDSSTMQVPITYLV